MSQPRKIAVLYPTSLPWMARMLDGIRRYSLPSGGWQLLTCPPVLAASGERQRSLRSLVGWRGDAVIAAIRTAEEREIAAQLDIPVVNISSWDADTYGVPRVSVDNFQAGRAAAGHLISQGLENLGYVGWKGVHFSDLRLAGFFSRAEESGIRARIRLEEVDRTERRTIAEELHDLGVWLKSLPLPCGVFAVHDYRAQFVMEACVSVGLRVPRDVAVIGMDDDTMVCERTTPTLSSVSRNPERVGWEIAALIDRMLKGGSGGSVEMLVQPDGVVERQSTNRFHHADEVVQLAANFMLGNLKETPVMQVVAEHAGVSKRTLEMRFKQATGMTPHRYLTKARIEHAGKLIRRSGCRNLREVAEACGFSSYPAFVAAFRAVCGQSPAAFQREHQRAS